MHLYCFFNENRTKSVQEVQQFTTHFDQVTNINRFEDLVHLKSQTIVVFGGDGTFHAVVNAIDFSNRLVFIPCGSGNDFIRSLKTKKKVVPIKKYVKKLRVSQGGFLRETPDSGPPRCGTQHPQMIPSPPDIAQPMSPSYLS